MSGPPPWRTRSVATGGTAVGQPCDVARSDDFVAARDRVLDEFGGVDVVVNNVGVMAAGRPEVIPVDEWQRILDLNVLGIVRSNEVFLPMLIEQGRGHVVNTSSVSGILNYAYDRTPYAASKAAVMMLSEALFMYLRPLRRRCVVPVPRRGSDEHPRADSLHRRAAPAQCPRSPDRRSPTVAGTRVADAIERRDFLVVTADEVRDELRRKGDDLDAYLRAQERWIHEGA